MSSLMPMPNVQPLFSLSDFQRPRPSMTTKEQVGVFFGEVNVADGQADRLGMVVNFTDVNDEIIGRCIVGSIEWTL